jgi:hypothetical protein
MTIGIEIHVPARSEGSFLPVVERRYITIGTADHPESTTADVASLRIHHRQRERCGDGCIDCVATCLENVPAYLTRVSIRRHDHAVRCPDRLRIERERPVDGNRVGDGSGLARERRHSRKREGNEPSDRTHAAGHR